jgi:type IV secretory pathway VirB2 component (pilin)
MVIDIIIIILGTLGTIFVILIIIAGFQWMTASGDSEKVDEAKDRIKNSVIGIVIILASYAIVNFVIKVILSTTQDNN